jgi:hypothetical protein
MPASGLTSRLVVTSSIPMAVMGPDWSRGWRDATKHRLPSACSKIQVEPSSSVVSKPCLRLNASAACD